MPRPPSLLATLVALCVALSACSGGSDEPDRSEGTTTPSGSTDASGTGASPGATDEASPPVMVGDHPHRPACRLFTPTDAVEVLRLAGEAEFDQQALVESVSEEDGPDPDQVDISLATSSCTYRLGDGAGHCRGGARLLPREPGVR